jgi:uncharacterized protein YjiS (DUF1127 family)
MRTDDDHGSGSPLARLMRALRTWSESRARRRNTQLYGFMILTDRALADIGVRRADVHAVMSGMMPVEHIARTHGGDPWTAQVQPLRRPPAETLAANDLSAAA